MDINKTYILDDISLTAFLLLQQGIDLVEIKEDRPRHFVFILSNPEKCSELKQQYLNNASAPARQLFFQKETLIGEIKNRN